MSDSPTTASGFGNVTRHVCAGLAKRGHSVLILGWQASGAPKTWQGCIIYPIGKDPLGSDVLLSYLQRLRPDILVTLADVWWMSFIADPIIKNFLRIARIPWALYFPIDGEKPGGTLPQSWIRMLNVVDIPIVMSKYGHRLVEKAGVRCHYIPHGVDEKIFRPPTDKQKAKSVLGYDGYFIVLSDSRNQIRKMLPRLLDTFCHFSKGKDDVLLHLHCDPADPAARLVDYNYSIQNDVRCLGITEKVRFTSNFRIDAGLELDQLASIYSAADVHLLMSLGEGFGLPNLQAAASGVVPFAPNYSANSELLEGHGIPINVIQFVEDQFGICRAYADIDHAVAELNHLYINRDDLIKAAEHSRKFAEAYSWTSIIKKWEELLTQEVNHSQNRVQRKPENQNTIRLQSDNTQGRADLINAIRSALPKVEEGTSITMKVTEDRAGEITFDLIRDAYSHGHEISIPTTLPVPNLRIRIVRVPGKVFSTQDTHEIFFALRQIFPILNLWSRQSAETSKLNNYTLLSKRLIGNFDSMMTTKEFINLSESTLCLGGAFLDWPELPILCAILRIPCVGFTGNDVQNMLWPDLSITSYNSSATFLKARQILTDYVFASACCKYAEQKLIKMNSLPSIKRIFSLFRAKSL